MSPLNLDNVLALHNWWEKMTPALPFVHLSSQIKQREWYPDLTYTQGYV